MAGFVNKIKVWETSKSPQQLLSPKRRVCHVCTTSKSKYVCPRCNAPYCSLLCYKKHSVECTEEFYMELVQEEMKQNKRTMDAARMKVRSFKESCSEDQFELEELDKNKLTSLLHKIESGQFVDINELDAEHRKKFLTAVYDGQLSREVSIWKPWWSEALEVHSRRHIIQPSQRFDEVKTFCVFHNKINIIKQPSIKQKNHDKDNFADSSHIENFIVEVLFGYAAVSRRFNGEWTSDAISAASFFLKLSKSLKFTDTYFSVEEVVSNFSANYSSSTNKYEMDLNSFVASIVKDVQDILRYKHYILDALSDSSNIFKFASDVIKEEGNHTESTSSQPLTCSAVRRQFKFAKKKIVYFVTWLQRHHQRVSWNKIIPALTWSIQAMALQDSVASE